MPLLKSHHLTDSTIVLLVAAVGPSNTADSQQHTLRLLLHLALASSHSAKMKVTIALLLVAAVAVNAQIQVCDPKLKVRLLPPWDGVKHFAPCSSSATQSLNRQHQRQITAAKNMVAA
jgi:uncharacterized protein YmfQ (DUF2313 family)